MRNQKRRKIAPVTVKPFDLSDFRVELISLIRDSKIFYHILYSKQEKKEWIKKGGIEKVKKILEETKYGDSKLYRCIKVVKFQALKTLFNTHFQVEKKKTKESLLWFLLAKFYEEKTIDEKREEEKINLDSFGNLENEFRFFEICNRTIPNEIVKIILSYVKRNYSNLWKIGGLCKHFYISLLTSWDHILVNKKNVLKIPMIVLKNLKSINIRASGYTFPKHDRVRLWDSLNTEKLQLFSFSGKNELLADVLVNLNEYMSKKQINPMKSVTEVKFNFMSNLHRYDNKWEKKFMKSFDNFGKTFPKLRVLKWITGYTGKVLLSKLPKTVTHIGFLDNIQFPERIESSEYERIKKLEFYITHSSYNDVFFNVSQRNHLEKFHNVEELSIDFRHACGTGNSLDFGLFTQMFKKLKRLRISEDRGEFYFSSSNQYRGVTYADLKIEELQIISEQKCFDICVEDMMKYSFFKDNESLKVFKCHSFFLSKKRRNNRQFLYTEETCKVAASLVNQLLDFFVKKIFNFKCFDLCMSEHIYFFENLRIKYDQSQKFGGLRRLRVDCEDLTCSNKNAETSINELKFEGANKNEINEQRTLEYTKKMEDYLEKNKNSVFLLMQLFISEVVPKIVDKVDFFSCNFSFEKIGLIEVKDRSEEMKFWKDCFLDIKEDLKKRGYLMNTAVPNHKNSFFVVIQSETM